MEEMSSDTDFCYKIPRWNFPSHYLNYRLNRMKTKSFTDDDEYRKEYVLLREIHPNVFIVQILENYDSYK
jgi:hypothetical protein